MGTRVRSSPSRNRGRVRVGSVEAPAQGQPLHRGRDLVVTSQGLTREVLGLLAALDPPVRVRHLSQGALLERGHSHSSGQRDAIDPGAVLLDAERLDGPTLAWTRQIVAATQLPVIAVVPGHASQRSQLRERAREAGALDCLLRSELSTPLLEACVAHARSHSRQSLRLGELRERFALAIRGSRDGMWEWDLSRGRVYYSQRWRELLGLELTPPPTLETWLARVHPQDVERLRADLEAHISGEIPIHENEHRIRGGDGQWRWVLSRAVVHRDARGQARRMAGSLTDISPYRRRERAIRERSRRDTLTQLPDRRVFLERLARAIELAREHEDFAFVVLLVEIDRHAQIRDSFGLPAANEVLALMARRLRESLRPDDLLFRYSNHRFAIVLEDIDEPSFGTHIADRIHERVAEPFEVEGSTTYTTVSIGMTSSAHTYQQVEELITDVSAAVDSARERGRNRHEIYDTSMRIESRTLLALEMAMRRALDHEQFQLHYQPIVDLDGRRLLGFESLLRWEHPERGAISPGEFIPIAEDTGMIVPMGRWVLRRAVRQLHSWREEFNADELTVSVNLSAKQLRDPLLLESIDSVLAETRIDPTSLKLELTESVMLEQAEHVMALLQEIRARGVEVWLDDFGTGYSSLGYLHRFPVDGLKIDRTFVSPLDGWPQSATMVRTILGLAQNLGLRVVAEGIETEVQAKQLEDLGCRHGQGWLFGRPRAAARIAETLPRR